MPAPVRPAPVDPTPFPRHDGAVATIRLALAEDNLLAREGFLRLFERTPGIEVVAACEDADALRDAVAELAPDVVVTDIRMPPTGQDEGIRLSNELRATHPGIGVVVVSQHVELEYALALFEGGSGGRAYLLKERLADEGTLGRAVHEVVGGGSMVDPLIVEALLADRMSEPSPLDRLTGREQEILGLLAEGKSNEAIAEQAGIGTRAVERHVNAIFAKLDLVEDRNVNRRVRATLLYLAERHH